ncbi:MAG: hemerythrin family protein [Magnetococcales bacterium]|nr:hemerythrin family protein [Magnetococcales bacterium]
MSDKPRWSEKYRFGIAEIDRQHQQLFAIFWELHTAIGEGSDLEKVNDCFDRLHRYVMTHFAYEEQLMTEYDFPQLLAHRQQHADIRDDLQALLSIYNETEESEVKLGIPHKVAEFLEEWLEEHIHHSDRQYALHLLDRGVS